MKDYRLGNKIYELRKSKNLTQEDLALLLDISDKSVSKWENGSSKPTISKLSYTCLHDVLIKASTAFLSILYLILFSFNL